MIPFDYKFEGEKQDKNLKLEFRETEHVSAIFNWLLEGYKMYTQDGIKVPARAEKLLKEYRENADSVNLFMECKTEKADGEILPTGKLHKMYEEFCFGNGTKAYSLPRFYSALQQKYTLVRRSNGNIIKDRRFKENADETMNESKTEREIV